MSLMKVVIDFSTPKHLSTWDQLELPPPSEDMLRGPLRHLEDHHDEHAAFEDFYDTDV